MSKGPKFAMQIGSAPLAVRGNDLYETPPVATRALLRHEPELQRRRTIIEPACGPGAIVRVLRSAGHRVIPSDLINYGERACEGATHGRDFLLEWQKPKRASGHVLVTNPPYKIADDFIRHALRFYPVSIFLLRLAFLEGASRSDIIDGHLSRVWLGRERLPFMHRDGFDGKKQHNSAAPFAWFVFEQKPARPGVIDLQRISWREPGVAPTRAPRRSKAAPAAPREPDLVDAMAAPIAPRKRPTPTERRRNERKTKRVQTR